ncbi:hypothetical protein [Myceligenerans indicum]|uniref:Uncharacterized protein n=1 Tax=Myceligenerans indicum TaxID=2593663 RepID=A0ABS1LRF7_9MICO|nr:hypothetical protein [Myceligenerans indicum]MBL0888780.1 hypothetical protein [Myceligenerans indicum]
MGTYRHGIGQWVYERRSAVVAGAGAFVVTMLCAGGAVALMIEDRPRYEAGAVIQTVRIPAIVTADVVAGQEAPPASVDRLLGESRVRSVETIAAGEAVYTAAEQSAGASPDTLRRLRDALDEASHGVQEELPDGASQERREQHIRDLEAQRTSVLDAASAITQVRHVPAEELPAGTTTTTGPVMESSESPGGEPSEQPSQEPSREPSQQPGDETYDLPTDAPSGLPTDTPSEVPSDPSSDEPAGDPSQSPPPAPEDETGPPPPADDPDAGGLGGLFDKGEVTGDPTPSPSATPAG